ncbi:MAG: acetamidase/formamidase family protein [Halobacteriaceae archaeon]
MQTIDRDDALVYEYGPDLDPVLTVDPGERFRVETWDARAGMMFEDGPAFEGDDVPELGGGPPGSRANPVAGPVRVEGASAGDALAVHLHEVVPADTGWTGYKAGVGVGPDAFDALDESFVHHVRHEPGPSGTTADGRGVLELDGRRWEWDLNPHVGTVATAPARGRHDTVTTQGPWGGNVDVRHVAAGNTVYLDSFVDGGFLFLGDVHGSQGDSELTVMADETPADLVVSVDIVEDYAVPGVFRVETPDTLVQVESARNAGSYQNALDGAFTGAMRWLVDDHGFTPREAYLHMSVNSGVECHVYQYIPDAGYFTCGVEFPRDSLDPV